MTDSDNKPAAVPECWAIEKLRPHPRQGSLFPDLPAAEFEQLKDDIRRNGQRVPIEILPDGTILCGHQRLRALTLLGRTEVLVVVRHDLADNQDAAERRLIDDNLLRRQLDPLGRARCLERLMEIERGRRAGGLVAAERGVLRDRVAARLGLSGRNVARYLSVLKLPMPLQVAFSAGRLTLLQASRLALMDSEVQAKVADALEEGQDVTETLRRHAGRREPHKNSRPADLVGGLRRWMAGLGDQAIHAGPLSDEDRQTLTEARDAIGRLLGRSRRRASPRDGKAAC